MATSMNLHPPLRGGRPDRVPVGSLRSLGFLFGQLRPCCLSVWEKLRPSWGRLGTAWPWLFVP